MFLCFFFPPPFFSSLRFFSFGFLLFHFDLEFVAIVLLVPGAPAELEQALVLAHQDDQLYGSFLRSTIGITFLGTPHRGSHSASLPEVMATIANVCIKAPTAGLLPGPIRADLLKSLEHEAKSLENLADDVKNRFENMAIISFYETEPVHYLYPKHALVRASLRISPVTQLMPPPEALHLRLPGHSSSLNPPLLTQSQIMDSINIFCHLDRGQSVSESGYRSRGNQTALCTPSRYLQI